MRSVRPFRAIVERSRWPRALLPDPSGRRHLRRTPGRATFSRASAIPGPGRAVLGLQATLAALAVIVAVGSTGRLRARDTLVSRALGVITLVELPLVLPPAVAGIALLAALGPQGLLGGGSSARGVRLVFETAGVIVALVFVAAPFFISQAQAAFSAVDRTWLEASRTLGASEAANLRVGHGPERPPRPALGARASVGRALGEFGATLIFAGSLRGVTQTAPLAIYELFATDLDAALALSAVLVAVSAALLLAPGLLGEARGPKSFPALTRSLHG